MNARLLILGLLAGKPMHGYEIQRAFEQSRVDQWADILKGSVYHALKKMADEGLLKVTKSEPSGRGVKSVYAITAAGREEFRRLLKKAWSSPSRPFPTTLYAAMVFFDALPAAEIREAIEARIEELEREIETWRLGERAKAEAGALPEHARLMFDSARQHLEVDLRLLHSLRLLTSAPSARRSR